MRKLVHVIIMAALVAAAAAWAFPAPAEVIAPADVPMSDGTVLKADVYLPGEEGAFPVVLDRTPYNRRLLKGDAGKFLERGIAFVAVDVRGRFESGGDFTPFLHEGPDGVETLRWVLSQEWCNGKVAGHGGSYVGYTQWAISGSGEEGLVALVPLFTTGDMYRVAYRDGAFNLATLLGWASTMYARDKVDPAGYLMSRRGLKKLPLISTDNASGRQLDFYDQWIMHPEHDEFWDAMDHAKGFEKKDVPALMVAGWFDLFLGSQIDDFQKMVSLGPPETAGKSRLVIGPWDHSGGLISTMLDLPDGAKKFASLEPVVMAWYERWLKGEENDSASLPPVRVFVMGSNEWVDLEQWPPAGSAPSEWYFHSSGDAGSQGGGVLDRDRPGDETPDEYTYDPRRPTPSRGGTVLGADMGPYDYSEVDQRPDVLSFTTEPLKEALTVAGPVEVVLYAESDTGCTDFVGRLLDVSPGGTALPLAEGVTRIRDEEDAPGIDKGPVELSIDLWHTAFTFMPGHSIRVDIASAAFPHWSRNLNVCGGPHGRMDRGAVAHQKVYHDDAHPSHAVLPVFEMGD